MLAFACSAYAADAEKPAAPRDDDLDVTMQVIADPNAKLPDEVIRRIPLPPRKANAPAPSGQRDQANESASRTEERNREAQEVGREISERAKERTQEATDQREQARRSIADERRRNPSPPRDPPDPPRPPR
jgi:hypothetical protein